MRARRRRRRGAARRARQVRLERREGEGRRWRSGILCVVWDGCGRIGCKRVVRVEGEGSGARGDGAGMCASEKGGRDRDGGGSGGGLTGEVVGRDVGQHLGLDVGWVRVPRALPARFVFW